MSVKKVFVGLDLSFTCTGITIYSQADHKIGFYRIATKRLNNIFGVNTIIYSKSNIPKDFDFKHNSNERNNGADYSNSQVEITQTYFVLVNSIIQLISKKIQEYGAEELYVSMEGSLLSGHDYNFQIGLNMLQGYLRGMLLTLQLKYKLKNFKIRVVPPTLLKSFFAFNGKAEKKDMVVSFIENYRGKSLVPSINTSNKMINELNDVVDSFALVCFDLYDLSVDDKYIFNPVKKKPPKGSKKKRKRTSKYYHIDSFKENLPESDFGDNIESEILKNILC